MPTDLVIFDLGRVLIRICDNWRHACEVAGIAPPPERPIDPATRAALDDVMDRFDTGAIDERTFAEEFARCHGARPQDVIRAHRHYLRGPYPGAHQLVD